MSPSSAPAFVPLDHAVRELACSPELKRLTWLPGRFEEAVELALANGVPMRGRPAPNMRSYFPKISSLSRRIHVQPDDHLEFSPMWNVTVTRSNGHRETFEFVEVDCAALEAKLAEIAEANGLALPARYEDDASSSRKSRGRERHPLYEPLRKEYLELRAQGEKPTSAKMRAWLEQAHPDSSHPDRKLVERWVRGWSQNKSK